MKDRKMPRPWTDADTATLRTLADAGLSLREIGERMGREPSVINARARRHGVSIVRVCNKIAWTPAEDALLTRIYATATREQLRAAFLGRTDGMIYNRAHERQLKKSKDFMREVHASRLVNNHATRFQKGLTPWNAGMKGFDAGGRSVETRFKKGERTGAAARNYVPIGSHRLSKDGYLERKFTDDPSLNAARRWEGVHRIVWREAHGEIPAGHVVAFKPGQRTSTLEDITADRLELLTTADNMRRNSYHTNYPKDVALLVQLRGALNRKIRNRSKAA